MTFGKSVGFFWFSVLTILLLEDVLPILPPKTLWLTSEAILTIISQSKNFPNRRAKGSGNICAKMTRWVSSLRSQVTTANNQAWQPCSAR